MKNNSRWRMFFSGRTKHARRLVWCGALGHFMLTGAAQAQSVMAPPSLPVSLTPPAIEALGPGEMQVFPPDSALANVLGELSPLQWGPVTLRPHVTYQFTYGTDVQSGPGQQHDTVEQIFSPGVLFVYGAHWTLDYTPSFTFYSDKNFKNNVGQSVALTGGTAYEDWTLGFLQTYTYTSSPQVQTGTQTGEQTYLTHLSASRPLSSKISMELGISQDLFFPTDFQSSKEWSTMDWLNYQFWPRLVAGVGAGFGYVVTTPDRLYEQLQARINWRATDKISFAVNGGPEFMQFPEGGIAPLRNPVFGGSIQYQPFEHTQFSINASQAVNSSYYQNQITKVASFGANLNQRLFQNFHLLVGGGYNRTTYYAAPGVAANDSSEYYSVNVQLSTTILKRGSVSVFYTYSDNTTTQAGLAFSSSQFGFNLGYSY